MSRSIPYWLAACLLSYAIPAWGGVIFQHSGGADPTTEGWSVGGSGGVGVITGSLTNDAGSGLDAWFVNDTSAAANSNQSYFQTPTAPQISQGSTSGWSLTVRLRIPNASETDNASPFVSYTDGSTDWRMHFGSEADGDPFILLWDGGGTFGSFTGATYTLQGVGSTYHTYQFVYDPSGGSADLFVDGIERLSDYTGFATANTAVSFGAGSSADMGQGNFNLVQWSVVPEPSALALGMAALAALVALGWRRRGR